MDHEDDDITSLPDEAAIIRKIEEIRIDRELALRADVHTAVQNYHRLEAQLLERLAEVRAEQLRSAVPGGKATDQDLVDTIVEAIPQLPDDPFERIAEAVDHRREGPQDGRELDDDEEGS